MKWVLELEDVHLEVLLSALDFWERVLGLGQLEEIEYAWRWDADVKAEDFREKSDALRSALNAAKWIGWELPGNASLGVRSEKVPERFQIAYDMQKAIKKVRCDYRIATSTDEKEIRHLSMTVDSDPYWPTRPDVPKVQLKVVPNGNP